MKKFLPLILFVVGVIVVVGAFLLIRNQKKETSTSEDDESALVDVPLEKRPIIYIIPSEDGHYLKLKIDKIIVDKAAKVDYFFEYDTAEGIGQAVPGVKDLNGEKNFETDILLGTVSSGKYRYDEGVENGNVELKLRDKDGKLLAKFKTDFHLQTGVTELTSPDGKFTYTLEKPSKDVFFVIMQTVGVPDSSFKAVVVKDGYAVFASDGQEHPGSSSI